MRKYLVLPVLLLPVLTVHGIEHSPAGDPFPEDPDKGIKEPESAECGDGVCQPELVGVCPEDCQEGYEPPSRNETGEQREIVTPLRAAIAVSGFFGFLTVVLAIMIKRSRSEKEPQDKEVNEELENTIRRYYQQGYSMNDIIDWLEQQGYSREELEEARKNFREAQ